MDNIYYFKLKHLFVRLNRKVKRILRAKRLKLESIFFKKKYDKRPVIFVIQDHYEVAKLQEYMPEYLFINPLEEIKKK